MYIYVYIYYVYVYYVYVYHVYVYYVNFMCVTYIVYVSPNISIYVYQNVLYIFSLMTACPNKPFIIIIITHTPTYTIHLL